FEGRRRIGHGGAIYGFATDLSALPDEKLGVVGVAARGCVNAVTTRVADEALRHLLAGRHKKPLPKIEETAPRKPELARQLAGRYRGKGQVLDLEERAGRLYLWPGRGGFRGEVRQSGSGLVVDGRLGHGPRLEVKGDRLRLGKGLYERVAVKRPAAPPAKWA